MKPETVEVPVTVCLRLGWHEPGPSVIYVTPEQNRALGPVQNRLDAGVLADVLTELHLRRTGFCSESHRDEAEAIADLYASRDGETLYQDRNAGERAR